jgi:outer membrane autotransporter protein
MRDRDQTGRYRRKHCAFLCGRALYRTKLRLLTGVAGLVMLTGAAEAQSNWSGAASSDWFAAANWGGGVPTSSRDAFLNLVLPYPTVIAGAWGRARYLRVGNTAEGALFIEANGSLTTRQGFIGHGNGSSGHVGVAGAGAVWTDTEFLVVGRSGIGSLAITDGGRVNAAWSDIGSNASGVGQATVTGAGSLFASSSVLTVGWRGSGALTIADGGAVTSVSGIIGDRAGSSGEVTVTGAGSNWTDTRHIHVGRSGTGSLRIENGGSVHSNWSTRIADASGSSGSVVVAGAGSRLSSPSGIFVGVSGAGSLAVEDGGVVEVSDLTVGGNGASGTVSVTGFGSRLATKSNSLHVGIAGSGSLDIRNGAEVTNAASDGYVGFFSTAAGEVHVDGAGSSWSSDRDIFIGVWGRGKVTASDGGRISAEAGEGTIHIANNAGAEGTLNIGAASGATPVSTGRVEAGSVVFGEVAPGTGRIVFNHTGDDYSFTPAIVGNGEIRIEAGRTALVGDYSRFTGTTSVTGGTLSANGVLRGTLGVSQAGRLSGSGTFGNVSIASGGTIAPGNSIGTLTIEGDATFAPGSRYEVEVDPAGTASDLILVTGRAILDGGSVIHVGEAGTYRPQSKYRILSAAGGVEGRFDEVRSDLAFLDSSLSYDTNDVHLTLNRNDIVFAQAAATDNQKAAAAALDSLTFGDSVHDAVVVLDATQARSAFEQLSGEIHATAKSALIGSSGAMRGIVEQRLRGTLGGGRPLGAMAAYASLDEAENERSTETPTAHSGLWGRAFGSWARSRGKPGISGVRHEEGGFLIGADRDLADAWALPVAFDAFRLGAFGGYSRSTFNLDTRTSSGASDNTHFGVYANAGIGALRLAGGVTHTEHRTDSVRRVVFPGLDERLTASYRARTTQLFAETGYRIPAGFLAFEPFAGLAYVNFDRDRYRESGGVAALHVSRDRQKSAFSTIGLRGFADFLVGDLQATAHGMIGWRHMLSAGRATTEVSLASTGPFQISGSSLERNAAIMESGISLGLSENATLSLNYDGRQGARSAEHGVNARMHASF